MCLGYMGQLQALFGEDPLNSINIALGVNDEGNDAVVHNITAVSQSR